MIKNTTKFVNNNPVTSMIILVLLVPLFLNYILFSWKMPGLSGNLSDWMGFLSNYSGGIIGGVVALIITRVQINSQKEENRINREIAQLPHLTKIKLEIIKIKENLISIKRVADGLKEAGKDLSIPNEISSNLNGNLFLQGIMSENRYTQLHFLDMLNQDTFNEAHFINDIIFQTNIIETLNKFDSVFNTLYFDLKRKWIRQDEVDKMIDLLKEKEEKTITEIELLRQYQNEYSELLLQTTVYGNKKHEVWNGLYENNFYFQKIDETLNNIELKISEIGVLITTKL
ncbi:hypothetical protein AB4Z45_21845 [Paenibacillus sp. MCAF9]|uniref:hypothetical protein n=1 Tax=Paenibacillus sp. MCAF9 TaxID=3233046 RepID=UPI003F969FE6